PLRHVWTAHRPVVHFTEAGTVTRPGEPGVSARLRTSDIRVAAGLFRDIRPSFRPSETWEIVFWEGSAGVRKCYLS
ncbi:hypothetical protein ACFQ07_19890, partial [Actinomadura adrarensis]